MSVVTVHLIITTSNGFRFLPKVLINIVLIVMIKQAPRIKAIPFDVFCIELIIGEWLGDVLFAFPVGSINSTTKNNCCTNECINIRCFIKIEIADCCSK